VKSLPVLARILLLGSDFTKRSAKSKCYCCKFFVDAILFAQKVVVMADPEAKGAEFEKKADKKLSGWLVFGTNYDDAAELLEKAANSYKLAKSCMLLCSVLFCGSFLSFLGFRTFFCIFH
jgi:hypothetical protein